MKPLRIVPVTGGFALHSSASAAKLFGARKRKGGQPDGWMVLLGNGKAGFDPNATPETAIPHTAEQAASYAHQIGRYMMGFGDLVYAYTETPEGFWRLTSDEEGNGG